MKTRRGVPIGGWRGRKPSPLSELIRKFKFKVRWETEKIHKRIDALLAPHPRWTGEMSVCAGPNSHGNATLRVGTIPSGVVVERHIANQYALRAVIDAKDVPAYVKALRAGRGVFCKPAKGEILRIVLPSGPRYDDDVSDDVKAADAALAKIRDDQHRAAVLSGGPHGYADFCCKPDKAAYLANEPMKNLFVESGIEISRFFAYLHMALEQHVTLAKLLEEAQGATP